MTHFDPSQVQRAARNLLTSKNNSAMIKLCTTFQRVVDWDFESIIKQMARSKDWASAELLIRTFEPEQSGKSASAAANWSCLVSFLLIAVCLVAG